MNRKLIFFIALVSLTLCFAQVANAQSLKASFGIKGGGVTTIMSTEANATKLYPSGYGGLFLGLRLGGIGIQGEIDFSFQGAHYNINDTKIKTTQRYLQIPILLQIWVGRVAVFEVGYQQSILVGSSFFENEEEVHLRYGNDPGAHDYYGSILAGATFNLGKVIFVNFRYAYGISNSYSIYNKAYKSSTIQIGIGFRLYNSKRTIYK